MNRTEPNNLRIHYQCAANKRKRQNFHQTLILWFWLFAITAIVTGALASAL
jgi:hypothetical protein